jgi:hypothetical protein
MPALGGAIQEPNSPRSAQGAITQGFAQNIAPRRIETVTPPTSHHQLRLVEWSYNLSA